MEVARVSRILAFISTNSQVEEIEQAERVEMNSVSSRELSEVITKYKTLCWWKYRAILFTGIVA